MTSGTGMIFPHTLLAALLIAPLAAKSGAAATRVRLAAALTNELAAQGDPRMAGEGHLFDEYPHANRGALGFYERFMKGEKIVTGGVNPTDHEKEPVR